MKKTALFLVLLFAFIAIAFLPFWDKIYSKIKPINKVGGGTSQLQIKAIKGNYTVFIDGNSVGSAKEGETSDFTQIKAGKRKVKIVRESDVKDFFYTFEREIEFLSSSLVEIEWEAGPTLESSSGITKYFSLIDSLNSAQLYILPFPSNAQVEFDSRQSSNNLFEIFDTATHTLKVSNGNGFESRAIQVNMTNEDSKKVLVGHKLIIEVYLYKKPFVIE